MVGGYDYEASSAAAAAASSSASLAAKAIRASSANMDSSLSTAYAATPSPTASEVRSFLSSIIVFAVPAKLFTSNSSWK